MCIRDSIFLLKGLDGARMQDIADEASINKAMLHYYFRNKQQLFDIILDDCLLYTSDAADERSSVDLGGRRIIKKKTNIDNRAVHVL